MKALTTAMVFLFTLTALVQAGSLDKSEIIIDPRSGVTEATVGAIIAARGGKDKNEVWHIDMLKGDVRIQKSTKDNAPYPPGGAVEFWFKDSAGTWKSRSTG